MAKRKVVVFTGNRAEYGLQYPVLKGVHQHPELDCHLLVSGAHLEESFGHTLEEIRSDGFHIDSEVKIDMGSDSKTSTANAIGSGVLSISSWVRLLSCAMTIGVPIIPVWMELERIPSAAYVSATFLLSDLTAAFEAVYAATPLAPT